MGFLATRHNLLHVNSMSGYGDIRLLFRNVKTLQQFCCSLYVICMTTYPTCVPYFDICGVVMKSIQLLMSMLCFHYLSICSDVLHRIPHSTNKFMNEENPSIEDKGEGDFMSGHTRIQSVYRIKCYFLHQKLKL